MDKPVCAIVGAGPGNGASFTHRFAEQGYAVAVLARNADYIQTLAHEVDGAEAFVYDVTRIQTAPAVFDDIRDRLGPVKVMIYNAGAGAFANFDEASAQDFERAWQVNARGCFVAAHQVVAHMRELGGGSIVVIGATASWTGNAGFLPFAAAKAAQRSLAQSMARHLGPQNIHVSYVIVDGIIDIERTRTRFPDHPDDFFLNPDHIADEVLHLAEQPPSAWTFELDLRPFAEKW